MDIQKITLTINSYFISIFLLLFSVFFYTYLICDTLEIPLISIFLFYLYSSFAITFSLSISSTKFISLYQLHIYRYLNYFQIFYNFNVIHIIF